MSAKKSLMISSMEKSRYRASSGKLIKWIFLNLIAAGALTFAQLNFDAWILIKARASEPVITDLYISQDGEIVHCFSIHNRIEVLNEWHNLIYPVKGSRFEMLRFDPAVSTGDTMVEVEIESIQLRPYLFWGRIDFPLQGYGSSRELDSVAYGQNAMKIGVQPNSQDPSITFKASQHFEEQLAYIGQLQWWVVSMIFIIMSIFLTFGMQLIERRVSQ